MNFEKIKYYILSGLWNEKMAKIAIKKGIITQQQYEDIINEKEEVPVTYFDTLKSKEVEWLWKPYIAFGKLTVLEGDPGDGKTTFALMLVSQLTSLQGREIKGLCSRKINVIYQSAEDGVEDTIKTKLDRMHADCRRVCFIAKNDLSLEDDSIEKAIIKSKAELLVFDPIQSFIGKEKSMNSADRKLESAKISLEKTKESVNKKLKKLYSDKKDFESCLEGKLLESKVKEIDVKEKELKNKIKSAEKKYSDIQKEVEFKMSALDVNLSTAISNYSEPKIYISLCKYADKEPNLIYSKAQLKKFEWAMNVSKDFWKKYPNV